MDENIKTELKLYESMLENKDVYIKFNASDKEKILNNFNETANSSNQIVSVIGIIIGGLIAFAMFPEEGSIFPRLIGCCIGAGVARMIYTAFHPEIKEERDKINKTLVELQKQIKEHNTNLFKNYINKTLKENNIHVNKEIVLESSGYCKEKVLIDDENKTFNIVKFTMPKNMEDSSSCSIKQAKYSEILRYSFIDKSTSTQVATSTTSSNSKKALSGAIVSDLLIGDATAGAVIGGSGARTTETTYKTKTINKYQITIYLNKLQDSVITINLESGNITNQIISTLEYILRNK